MVKRIGFLTHGDTQRGMGHIYRTLILAEAFRSAVPDARISFHCRAGCEGARVLVGSALGTLIPFDGDLPPPGETWDLLIVDQMSQEPAKMAVLRPQCRHMVILDDVGPGRLAADLAINGLYPPRVPRPPESRVQDLVGFEYVCMRDGFASAARDSRPDIGSVLLAQGATDTYGLLPTLVTILDPLLPPSARLNVLAPAFRPNSDLDAVIGALQRPAGLLREIPDMAAFMSALDLAVVGAGIMACELATVGVPMVLVTGEPHEVETATALEQLGCALSAGLFDEASPERIAGHVRQLVRDPDLRRLLSGRGRSVFDGKARGRIVNAILHLMAWPPYVPSCE